MRWTVVLVLAAGCATPPANDDLLAEALQDVARLEQEVATLKAALEEAGIEEREAVLEIVEARKENARLEDDVTAQKAALDRTADEEVKRLREEVRELNSWITEYRKRFGRMGGGKGPEGYVLRVEGASVTISVGSADGTEVGDAYHVRRRDLYVGRMRIVEVAKNRSRGVLDAKVVGPGAPPRRGDVAYLGRH
jgi:hypothetical protein